MITKEQKARLIIFSMVSLGLLVVFLALLLVPLMGARGAPYFVNFKGTSVNGLTVGAPVKYLGVEVGKVTQIQVHPEDLSSIQVKMEIQKSFPVRADMSATMTFTGITGSKFVELAGGTNSSSDLDPGSEIKTAPGLGEKAEDIVANIDTAVRRINDLLGPDNQRRFSQFLDKTEKGVQVLSEVLQAKRENLSNSITNVEKASSDFGALAENLHKISDKLAGLTGKLEVNATDAVNNFGKRFSDEEMGQVLKNLQGFIEIASSSMKKIENLILVQQADMRQTLTNLAAAVDNMSTFSRALVEDPTLFLRSRKGKK